MTKNIISSGDIFTLSLCLNNILFIIPFIVSLFITFSSTFSLLQSFIISFTLSMYSLISFFIAIRSYKKVVSHQDIKIQKSLKYIIISLVVNIVGTLGFGIVSNDQDYGSYHMFNFSSPIMIIWILIIMSITYFIIIWFYYEIYHTNVDSQNTVKQMMSPRKRVKVEELEKERKERRDFVKENKEEHKENKKELTIRPTNEIVNRKVAKKIISYISVFSLLWITTIITSVSNFIFENNKYINILWIIVVILNTLLSSVVYGLANSKVREYFSREPGKIRILINRLTEKKIKVKNIVEEIKKEEIVPSTPRVDSACGIHVIDMRGKEINEYKSFTPLQELSINSSQDESPLSSNNSTPEIQSPNSRIMTFKNINELMIAREKIKEEEKKKNEENKTSKKQISPNTTHSPTDLRAIRMKNLRKNNILSIPELKVHRTLTIGLPGIVEGI